MTAVIIVSTLLAVSCGSDDRASSIVNAFAEAIADSSYSEAWSLITPESRLWYDSTVSILREFGWIESQTAICSLAGEMTENEFLTLTGEDLFGRMVSRSSDVHNLSTSIKSVSYPDSLVSVVVVRTDDGLQEIVLRKTEGNWLIDLTSLAPPSEGG